MSNWDLMMPGMGLTSIGLAGVTISYAGIAHTFIDGMHALTGLTMFIGMIFLAAGILDGGVSTSNRAKATTLVILGIAFSFGIVAIVGTTISTLPTFAGVMLIVAIPSIVMAYMFLKVPQYAKPVGIIFILATGAAIAAYVGFGVYGPTQYLIPPPEPEEEVKAAPTAPVTSISILKDSGAAAGNPDYEPDVAQVPKGNNIEWINYDTVAHTATSSADGGDTFNSNSIAPGEKYLLDTSKLKDGTYEYTCLFHPWMNASVVFGGEVPATPAAPETSISILKDSATQGNPDYNPDNTQITKGNVIVWTNDDTAMHTSTSSDGKSFDSSTIEAGASYKLDTSKLDLGKYDYACSFHPWMSASFELVDSSGQRLAEGATATDPNSVPPEEPAPVEVPVEATEQEATPETPAEEAPAETPVEIAEASESVLVEIPKGAVSDMNCVNQCYNPTVAHVTVGGTITWKNADTAAHTATETNEKFNTGLLAANTEYSQVFSEAGTFDYMCTLHPWMKGQVIVG
ncbi:MAG: cupredoxin domain-containing protein [Candidatus Nitrosotenuis sp.]